MSYKPSEAASHLIDLLSGNFYTLDDGPVLSGVDISETFDNENDVAVSVRWENGDGTLEESFTFKALNDAVANSNTITVVNTEGEPSELKFYLLTPVDLPEGVFNQARTPKPR